jgi:protein-disulfide isomerase
MEPLHTSQKSFPAVPVAIVIGFALVAVAIFYTGGKNPPAPVVTDATSTTPALHGVPRAVDATDYIRGNPNAQIVMIEYSDYDCPFCKKFHTVMNDVLNQYGASGKVAWVFRQFPIGQLHPNAPKISEAALCVGSLGGSDAFWKFTDTVFDQREITEQTNMVRLPDYAEQSGVKKSDFEDCLNNGKMTDKVKESATEGFNIGARGTPYTVIMVGNQQAVINGAQSYETVSGIVKNLIAQLEGNKPTSNSTTTAQ